MNPFTVLNVDKDVSQKDIIRAVALAMREKKYSAADIAVAQKNLLDPLSRGCEAFLHHIDLSDYKDKLRLEIAGEPVERVKENGDSPLNADTLPYLDLFNS